MDIGLLIRFFGREGQWFGACVIILDADANVRSTGPDTILSGGIKSYAPRFVSGRIHADAVCLMPDQSALLTVSQLPTKLPTGEITTRQTLTIIDPKRIVAVEFTDFSVLSVLGIAEPLLDMAEFREGQLVG